jgi:hypothetical protein
VPRSGRAPMKIGNLDSNGHGVYSGTSSCQRPPAFGQTALEATWRTVEWRGELASSNAGPDRDAAVQREARVPTGWYAFLNPAAGPRTNCSR